jgi:hypothetical protein
MTLVKRAYYPVKIGVANATPGDGIGITVSAQGRKGPGYTLAYNVQTQTIEGMLPDGVYEVEAFNFGQHSSDGSITLSVRGGPAAAQVTLLPDSSIVVNVKEEFSQAKGNPNSIAVFGGNSLQGNLHGPRNYMNIFLEPADDFGQERGATLRPPTGPDDDSLVIENVTPGRYWVRVNSSRGFAASVTSGAIDLQHQPLVVGPAGTTSPIEVTMRDDGAELDGTVEDGASSTGTDGVESMPHVYLIPLPDSSGEYRNVGVPRSKFLLGDLQPGAYRILVLNPPQPELAYRDPEAMRVYDSLGIVVRLEPGQKEQVRLHAASANP